MKPALLVVLWATLPALAQINNGGSGGGSGASAPNAWAVSRSCGGATNCTQVKADGRYVVDATSNSSTTITCPNSDCNFTQADVGKTVWATTQGTVAGVGYLINTTYVCPVTTISTINSAQSITVGTACTANGTANVALYWATDDGTALSGLDAAVGCSVVYLPDSGVAGNYMLTSQPFLVTAPSASTCNQQITTSVGNPAPAIVGTGFNASQSTIMISPNFNWAGCKAITGASGNVCLFGTARGVSNILVWGSGLTSASNANCANGANKIVVSASPTSSVINGVDVAGICPGETGMRGIELNAADENLSEGGAQNVGQFACAAHGSGLNMLSTGNDCHNAANGSSAVGLVIDSGAYFADTGSYPLAGVSVSGSATMTSRGTHFTAPQFSTAGGTALSVSGTWISYGDFVGVDGGLPANGVSVGGTIQLANTYIKASAEAILNNGAVFSNGGNKLGALFTGSGTWSGVGVLTGTCRGTATSSATLGLYTLGQSATANCTSTTVNLGQMVTVPPISGSVFGLAVSAGTGCKSGNTCVFTVLKNGSATTITCSLTGGASACQDTNHFDIPVAGDTYSIQFTTGATETLANVTATLLAW